MKWSSRASRRWAPVVLALLGEGCGTNIAKPVDRGPLPEIELGTTVTPSGTRQTPPNAFPFTQTCGLNEVVTGYTITTEGHEAGQQLQSLQGHCARLAVDWGSTLRVTTAASAPTAAAGMTGGVEQSQACPEGEMVVAFSGRSGSDIDQIAIVCAPLIIDGAYPHYRLSLGAAEPQPGIGNLGGAPFSEISCPLGQVAVGDEGRAGTIVNTVGLLCGETQLIQ